MIGLHEHCDYYPINKIIYYTFRPTAAFLNTLTAGHNWPAEVQFWPAGDVSKMVESGKWPSEAKTCCPRRRKVARGVLPS